jgi:hypothetical protein
MPPLGLAALEDAFKARNGAQHRGLLLSKADDLTPSDYVLDGQKRLTAIYSCPGATQEPTQSVSRGLTADRHHIT